METKCIEAGMKGLFDEVDLNGLKLKNRLIRSATGENLASSSGHIPPDLFDIYKDLAKGGVGLIMLSFTSVAAKDHFNSGLLRLSDDSLIGEYKELSDMIHSYGAKAMPQLALGIYQKEGIKIDVDDMSLEDIENIKRMFIEAAIRAKKANFDGIELHGCHGFVLASFLDPKSNHRKDEYGSSILGRTRIIRKIIKEVKKVCSFHISMKINGSELDPSIMIESLKAISDAGLDSIEYEGYCSNLSLSLKRSLNIPLILTGAHRDRSEMEYLLSSFNIEFFGLSRPLIREPGLPLRWFDGDNSPSKCISCGMCMSTYGFRCALIPSKYERKK